MKLTPEESRIVDRMGAGVLSREGMLGTDTRPLPEIIDTDHATVGAMGLTHERIAARLDAIYRQAEQAQGAPLEAAEGLVVETHSEKIVRLRRNLAELLVAEAPNSKAIQDLAVRCGVREVRYPFHNVECVQCGRCVRVCEDMWQAKALGFVGRGADREVDFPLGKRPDFCKRCHSCIDLCPMTIPPCPGPMKPGEEFLCGRCESQLSMVETMPETCVQCELGAGFGCSRAPE